MTTAHLIVGFVITILAMWLLLVIALFVIRPKDMGLAETMRLVPDLIRLLSRLSKDRSLPRSVRLRVGLLLVYLASPIDLIPDFIPVVGYADDAILTYAVLRIIVKRTTADVLKQHWSGSPEGLDAVRRLLAVRT
jgi:uncharacterized membrane protein YkvA (DUF1232 family)